MKITNISTICLTSSPPKYEYTVIGDSDNFQEGDFLGKEGTEWVYKIILKYNINPSIYRLQPIENHYHFLDIGDELFKVGSVRPNDFEDTLKQFCENTEKIKEMDENTKLKNDPVKEMLVNKTKPKNRIDEMSEKIIEILKGETMHNAELILERVSIYLRYEVIIN